MEQHRAVADFYRSKFTNGELRNWMVGRLSGLYFQACKLAYDLLKVAEKALQFELPTTETFITPGHWDSLRKGLLARESLLLQLNRMDKVHLDQDSRFQDIEKTISMQRSFPELLDILKQSGTCELTLNEREGTGAISSWRLDMPPENNPSLADNNGQLKITDVIFHLRYTSKFDNGAFRQAVQALMKA